MIQIYIIGDTGTLCHINGQFCALWVQIKDHKQNNKLELINITKTYKGFHCENLNSCWVRVQPNSVEATMAVGIFYTSTRKQIERALGALEMNLTL